MNVNYIYRFLRFLLVATLIVIGAVLVYLISSVTYPFIFALVIAFLINPLVNFFERKGKMPRSLAVFLGIIIVFAIVAGLLTLLIAEIISGANYLSKVVPDHFEKLVIYIEDLIAGQLIPLYQQLTNMFDNLDTGQQQSIMENIQNVGKTITTNVGQFIQSLLQIIPEILGWLPNAATVIIFSMLATFFISKDWEKLIKIGQRFIPAKARTSSRSVFLELKKALFGFIKAQATLISITAVIVLIGLLVLRVEYAITIALIIGIVDVLPYLGTGLVFVPWIIYAAFSGDIQFAIGLGVLYLIVVVQRQIMEPKILSSSIGLDPLATLIALFVGFKLIGFLGLIIGPVTLVVIKTLHSTGVLGEIWEFIIGKQEVK
ncbi:sporulation integral membrane protein YtvI [Ferdinandcohnia quinoae]|uniref:Sporulation integral membrane protein YtvI n=1 Tax=Fredinandcohnia quinoae TaxID=2918902 RepID=A0AAW5ED53_9BACI|nr:sporulation integral membrane protein YtvI [Fredinandcohnia sp. SECRCQ15]MCH1627832.1 sporulation integral membrane protein YtvI [Fredinandcohnia sp. SECRCQ15]